MAARKLIYDPQQRPGRIEEVTDILRKHGLADFYEAIAQRWEEWVEYRAKQCKATYAMARTEATAIRGLHNDSGHNIELALRLIDYSEGHTWQGIFRPTPAVWREWIAALKPAESEPEKKVDVHPWSLVEPDENLVRYRQEEDWPRKMWLSQSGLNWFKNKSAETIPANYSQHVDLIESMYWQEIVSLFGPLTSENHLSSNDVVDFIFCKPGSPFATDPTWAPYERSQFRMQCQMDWFGKEEVRRKYRTFTAYFSTKCAETRQ